MTKDTSPAAGLTALLAFLDDDARPSFIVDCRACDPHRVAHVPIVHQNPALLRLAETSTQLSKNDKDVFQDSAALAFRFWITRLATRTDFDCAELNVCTYLGVIWTASLHQSSYLCISGLPQGAAQDAGCGAADVQENFTQVVDVNQIRLALKAGADKSLLPVPDWLSPPSPLADDARQANLGMTRIPQSLHINRFHNVDWSATSLGPMRDWPPELHSVCTVAMADPEPVVLFLGDESVIVYNEAAIIFWPQVQGILLGSTMEKVLPEVWRSFEPIIKQVMGECRMESLANMRTLLLRDGRQDECFVSARFMPIIDRDGKTLGVYESVREVTKEVLAKRRLDMLLRASTCANNVSDKGMYWRSLIRALETATEDVAFAMIYSLDETPPGQDNKLTSEPRLLCNLEETMNMVEGHAGARKQLDLLTDEHPYASSFRNSLDSGASTYLSIKDHTLPPEVIEGVECRGYSSSCQGAIICPIRPTGGTEAVGFLVLGLSSIVAYNHEYRQFIDILNRQIAYSVASLILFQAEIERSRKRGEEAAQVHAQLQQRLDLQKQQLLTTEAKFQRLADKMTIAITITDATGTLTYANEAFYTITGHTGAEVSAESWIALVHEDDQPKAIAKFTELWESLGHLTFEIRMKAPWVREIEGAETITTATWLLASAHVEKDADGNPLMLISALTDISAQKWAEEVHHRRMVEALELKRQQENFIDTISHEIRNPLSAILQSADEITENINQPDNSKSIKESMRSSLEAVETIVLCCQHQRRVIDDVLMLSKINSEMLPICPVPTNPQEMVNSIVKIFAGESRKHDITTSVVTENPVSEVASVELLLDPNRFSQVLVNLMTNAIKFTRECSRREIRVTWGLFSSPPVAADHAIQYMEPKLSDRRASEVVTSTDSELTYLRLIVQDTGVGIKQEEKKRLFKKFSQASPRTYVHYGGSGLGLYISKQLCELQGGAIGMDMQDDEGTTFAFYIKAYRNPAATTTLVTPFQVEPLLNPVEENTIETEKPREPTTTMTLPSRTKDSSPDVSRALLVVEDNLINQRVMCRQLRQKGFTVHTANHGVEALSFLERTNLWAGNEANDVTLSAILLDIEMPVMDGLTCVRRIRQLEKEGVLRGHVPVISVSANARAQQIEDARGAGMDDNISKPFRIDELIPKIHALLDDAAGT